MMPIQAAIVCPARGLPGTRRASTRGAAGHGSALCGGLPEGWKIARGVQRKSSWAWLPAVGCFRRQQRLRLPAGRASGNALSHVAAFVSGSYGARKSGSGQMLRFEQWPRAVRKLWGSVPGAGGFGLVAGGHAGAGLPGTEWEKERRSAGQAVVVAEARGCEARATYVGQSGQRFRPRAGVLRPAPLIPTRSPAVRTGPARLGQRPDPTCLPGDTGRARLGPHIPWPCLLGPPGR